MHLLAEGDTVVGRDGKAGLVLDDARISSGSREGAGGQADPTVQPLRVSKTVFDNVATQRVSVLLENTSHGDPSGRRAADVHGALRRPARLHDAVGH